MNRLRSALWLPLFDGLADPRVDRFCGRARLADHLDAGLGGEDAVQPGADHRVVVAQDHPDRLSQRASRR